MPYKAAQPADRFWAAVDRSGGGNACWPWTRSKSNMGYGQFNLPKSFGGRERKVTAHRFAYEQAFGPIPAGAGYHGNCVCHHCDNPLCCNPAHLFLGTHADNMADMHTKGRNSRSGAPGQKNGRAKLTWEQVSSIRAATGSLSRIAKLYGIGKTQAARIRRGEQWTAAA